MPDNKPIRNNKAKRSEFTFLEKNHKDSKALTNRGIKLQRVNGTPNINPKVFRISFHTLST